MFKETKTNPIISVGNDLINSRMLGFNLTACEYNLFYRLCYIFKDYTEGKYKKEWKDTKIFLIEELREIFEIPIETSISNYYKIIISASNKLMQTSSHQETDIFFERINLFSKFHLNKKNGTLEIIVSKPFQKILFNLKEHGNFTKSRLNAITSLDSKYSKELYQQLMQYYKLSTRYFEKEDFIRILNLPKSLKTEGNLQTHVLKIVIKELSSLDEFKGIKLFKKKGTKNKILGYKFTWTVKKNLENSSPKEKIEQQEKINQYHFTLEELMQLTIRKSKNEVNCLRSIKKKLNIKNGASNLKKKELAELIFNHANNIKN